MNEDLRSMIDDSNDTPVEVEKNSSEVDMSAFLDRLSRFEDKLDKVLSYVKTDDEKISIAEAEEKINEHEEYREAEKESE